ncbi:MAG TPA: MarR family transcriptional regulator [Propionibacteriaceae bacterium]|nr:MarR family transcriptional regulator [Propionibacteriaceae bacterium]
MTTPEDLADAVLRTVARLNRWATMQASWELPSAQIRLLALIEELEPARITDLAQADHTSQPGITAQVNRLEGAGLVSRSTGSGDARVHRVATTGAGRDLLRRVRAARAEMLAPAFARLDADDLAAIRRAQELLAALIDQPPAGPA